MLLGLLVILISVVTKWAIVSIDLVQYIHIIYGCYLYVPPVIEIIAWRMMRLIPETLGYEVWQFPPVPVYTKFHVFNVTNPDQVQQGMKPLVEEIGPFTYLESREKRNIKRIGDEIEYALNIVYTFSPSESCSKCNEDLLVTVPNTALLASLGLLESLPVLETLGIKAPLFRYINDSISPNGNYSVGNS